MDRAAAHLGVMKSDLHTLCSSEGGIMNSHNDCHHWDDGEVAASRSTSQNIE